jgi:hypothetical protein
MNGGPEISTVEWQKSKGSNGCATNNNDVLIQ